MVFLCILLFMSGCNESLSPIGQHSLQAGREAYLTGNYLLAQSCMNDVLQEGLRTFASAEALYYRGRSRVALGDIRGAWADLEKAATISRDRLLLGGCAVAMGDLAYNQGAFEDALRYYDLAMANLPPDQTPADHAALMLAKLLQRDGQWERADAVLDSLVFHFPQTPQAHEASRIIRARLWTICAGAYDSRNQAQAIARQLIKKDLPARINEIPLQDGVVLAVEVGSYNAYEEALEALAETKQHFNRAVVMESR